MLFLVEMIISFSRLHWFDEKIPFPIEIQFSPRVLIGATLTINQRLRNFFFSQFPLEFNQEMSENFNLISLDLRPFVINCALKKILDGTKNAWILCYFYFYHLSTYMSSVHAYAIQTDYDYTNHKTNYFESKFFGVYLCGKDWICYVQILKKLCVVQVKSFLKW